MEQLPAKRLILSLFLDELIIISALYKRSLHKLSDIILKLHTNQNNAVFMLQFARSASEIIMQGQGLSVYYYKTYINSWVDGRLTLNYQGVL